MDESLDISHSFIDNDILPATTPRQNESLSTGLKLVLPPLKGGKPIKLGKDAKSTPTSRFPNEGRDKRIPRPVKLKPLKEVLTKLINGIKKKDDYAFFLKPVDPSQIPGYSDVVKQPMDLGTMATKVARGKYRSLEEFTTDFRLVTNNAKLFNPPGTIYHTEAERIETWGLDHITKAASTVIQYETDWNIEIENDDETQQINVDEDEEQNLGTPMDVDDAVASGRSPSVTSQVQSGGTRRAAAVRAPNKKPTQVPQVSESIGSGGRLPGSTDGLGAFPPESDWAKTMLALKLKGKRYKTKKERLRIEKEGPPYLPEGSLDFREIEDPFSVLSVFVSEPFTRPFLTPLYPPISASESSTHANVGTPQPQPQPIRPQNTFPLPVYSPHNHFHDIAVSTSSTTPTKRKHWTITRNPARNKGKEKDDDLDPPNAPSWQAPREPHASDFGSFALLAGELAEEMRRREAVDGDDQTQTFQKIRESLQYMPTPPQQPQTPETSASGRVQDDYWNSQRGIEAQDYLRDVVYGGVDGYAYVRSLAEFCHSRPTETTPRPSSALAKWVETHVVDDLTDGRHNLLRKTAYLLQQDRPTSSAWANYQAITDQRIADQIFTSTSVYPSAASALAMLLQIKSHKIDMGALIKTPEELFLSEEEWAGKIFRLARQSATSEGPKREPGNVEVEEPERTWMDVSKEIKPGASSPEQELEGPVELGYVLAYVADLITELDKRTKDTVKPEDGVEGFQRPFTPDNAETRTPSDGDEDAALRNIRLNLLALAKRAPLDTIARLPKDLVPEHIRHFVPTFSGTT